jgi:antitoxin FitA
MPNLSIKDVPEPWAEALRQRAAKNHRSLQGELLAMVEQFVQGNEVSTYLAPSNTQTRLSVEAIYQKRLLRKPKADTQGPQSVDIIRQDRDNR